MFPHENMCWLSKKSYALVSGVIFALIALLHLWRAIAGWNVVIGSVEIPLWASWLALVIAAYLAISGLRLTRYNVEHKYREFHDL